MNSLAQAPFVTCLNSDLLNVLVPERELGTDTYGIISRRVHTSANPTSFAQERIWLSTHAEGGSHNNEQFCIRLNGKINVPSLERSVNEIIRRHEVLRARFVIFEGELRQEITPTCFVPLPVIGIPDTADTLRDPIVHSVCKQEKARPFDIQLAPLLRTNLLQLGENDHVLVVTAHRMVFDAYSGSVFLDELLQLYQGAHVPELPIQYPDFAAWQREHLRRAQSSRELRYWETQLKSAPVFLELPTDRPRPATKSYHAARVPVQVGRELTMKLRALGQSEDCTLFITLLAAFQVLVHRCTGNDDIVIGSPFANRSYPELEGLIGCFLNTLLLRTDLSGAPTFRGLLGRVRKVVRGAFTHQDIPFAALVEKIPSAQVFGSDPPCRLCFAFQSSPQPVHNLAGLTIRPFEAGNEITNVDLNLHIDDAGETLQGWIEYATDLFESETIERLVERYTILLGGIVDNSHERISCLPLLSFNERAWQHTKFDHTQVTSTVASCVHEIIQNQIARTPNSLAVEFEGQQLTYSELDLRSNQLAHVLRSLELQPDELIAVCMDRSLEMVVALLGILKAGAAYLPLDPHFPDERLATILRDAQPRAVLTLRDSARNLSFCNGTEERDEDYGIDLPLIYLDAEVWEGMQCLSARPAPVRTKPEHLAYVIYTSGSTGKPKGVQVTHGAFANFLLSMQERPGIAADDKLLAITTASFDIAGLELFLPLTVGAKVIIASDAAVSRAAGLVTCFEQVQPTIMQATPAIWRLLIQAGWKGHAGLKILCGGEAWSKDLAAQLLARCSSLWNMYGPTEATVWSAVEQVNAGEPVLIGEPIANTSLYILDQHQQLLPIGVPGELYIGGAGLARGYLRRPELTEQKFVPDPFRQGQGERLYRTGDVACYRPNGKIEFLGRMDLQAKIRGFRVELSEMEAVLATHPAVSQAVVTVHEEAPGDQHLIAYIIGLPFLIPDADELQHFMRRKLPEYMVPSTFITVEALPLTPDGKLDRKALPRPERCNAATQKNQETIV